MVKSPRMWLPGYVFVILAQTKRGMFKHKGKGRTYSHNLRLASILSAVAGIVNITGVLALGTLTTNVTGHFAFFSEELFFRRYETALVYLFYILFFLLGAFVSSLLMEWTARRKHRASYVIPILVEMAILLAVSFSHMLFPKGHPSLAILLPGLLLFAMGLQNALVTRVSQSVVRTTHLTGLFTDLGIELSQVFFYKEKAERTQLNKSIFLKLMIIGCFFLGGNVGAFVFAGFGLKTLVLALALLLFALWYDRLLFRYHYIRRKFVALQSRPTK